MQWAGRTSQEVLKNSSYHRGPHRRSLGMRKTLCWKDLCDLYRAIQEASGVKFKGGGVAVLGSQVSTEGKNGWSQITPARIVGHIRYCVWPTRGGGVGGRWEPLSQTIGGEKRNVCLEQPRIQTTLSLRKWVSTGGDLALPGDIWQCLVMVTLVNC